MFLISIENARILLLHSRYKEAEEMAHAYIIDHPGSCSIWYVLADIYEAQGKDDEAVDAYIRCLHIDPNFNYGFQHFEKLVYKIAKAGREFAQDLSYKNFPCLRQFSIIPRPIVDKRPTLSVGLLTYNPNIRFLKENIERLLDSSVNYRNRMEFFVFDDDSKEVDVEYWVRHIGRDHVKFYRQPRNIFMYQQATVAYSVLQGEYLQVFSYDDLISPLFYENAFNAIDEFNVDCFVTGISAIDENSNILSNWTTLQPEAGFLKKNLNNFAQSYMVLAPACIIKRDVIENIGGQTDYSGPSGDIEYGVRLLAYSDRIWYDPRNLAYFRHHSNSQAHNNHMALREFVTKILPKVLKSYLPKNLYNIYNYYYIDVHRSHVPLEVHKDSRGNSDFTSAIWVCKQAINEVRSSKYQLYLNLLNLYYSSGNIREVVDTFETILQQSKAMKLTEGDKADLQRRYDNILSQLELLGPVIKE